MKTKRKLKHKWVAESEQKLVTVHVGDCTLTPVTAEQAKAFIRIPMGELKHDLWWHRYGAANKKGGVKAALKVPLDKPCTKRQAAKIVSDFYVEYPELSGCVSRLKPQKAVKLLGKHTKSFAHNYGSYTIAGTQTSRTSTSTPAKWEQLEVLDIVRLRDTSDINVGTGSVTKKMPNGFVKVSWKDGAMSYMNHLHLDVVTGSREYDL